MGKPGVRYTEEWVAAFCLEIASGVSLKKICRRPDQPHHSTVFEWLHTKPEFRDKYAIAKSAAMDAMAEEILEIADESQDDWKTDERGREIPNKEVVLRSRLRIETRKWLMCKLNPKKFGDKADVTGSFHHVMTKAEEK